MFDVPKLDEAAVIEIIDLYTYIVSAIDADFTSRQCKSKNSRDVQVALRDRHA